MEAASFLHSLKSFGYVDAESAEAAAGGLAGGSDLCRRLQQHSLTVQMATSYDQGISDSAVQRQRRFHVVVVVCTSHKLS